MLRRTTGHLPSRIIGRFSGRGLRFRVGILPPPVGHFDHVVSGARRVPCASTRGHAISVTKINASWVKRRSGADFAVFSLYLHKICARSTAWLTVVFSSAPVVGKVQPPAGLLARAAQVMGPPGTEVGAPRIDVKAAPARIARIHRQLARFALAQDVDEDPLDALFVEIAVLAV